MKNLIIRSLIFIWMLALTVPLFATDASLLPNGKQTFLDQNGNPLSSGKVYFYTPSTTTFKTTWQNAGKTVANTNPVTLDAAGRAIIYGDGIYRQVVRDSLGNLIWDQLTASTGGGGGTPTLIGDGNLVGTVLPWSALSAPNQYVFTYGQELSRAAYPAFFTAITLIQNINCSIGSPILTGLADTTQIPTGGPIETTCLAPGTIVVSKTGTTITVTNNATISISTTAVFFPWGNGNGSTTFNVPDYRGRVMAGRNNMGGTATNRLTIGYYGETPDALGANGGNQNQALATTHLPPYTPAGTIISTPTDPGHTHFTANSDSATTTITNLNTVTRARNSGDTNNYILSGSATLATIGISSSSATGVTVASVFTGTPQGGVSTAFPTIQPTITINYIVKVTPDVSSSTASGVASLGGMTGVIACGTGLICTGNIIDTASSSPIGNGYVIGNASGGIAAPTGINLPQLFTAAQNGSILPQQLTGLLNLVANPDWWDWSEIPASGRVTPTPPNTSIVPMPDGWGAGLGSGAQGYFERYYFTENQTDVPGSPQYGAKIHWTVGTTQGEAQYVDPTCPVPATSCRATYLEQAVEPQTWGMAQLYTAGVWIKREGTGTNPVYVVPTIFSTTNWANWAIGQVITNPSNGSGPWYRQNQDNDGILAVYIAASTGTTAAPGPSHTSGTAPDGGGVQWTFVGPAKGTTYDLYQGCDAAASFGTTCASGTTGQVAPAGRCLLTNSWQWCQVNIYLPAPLYTNTTDYTTTRTMVRWSDPLDPYTGRASMGGSLDLYGLPDADTTIIWADFQVYKGYGSGPLIRQRRKSEHLNALNDPYGGQIPVGNVNNKTWRWLTLSGDINVDASGSGAVTVTGIGGLSGVIKGNGASAPTALTGTATNIPKWAAGSPSLGFTGSNIYDNGTQIGFNTSTFAGGASYEFLTATSTGRFAIGSLSTDDIAISLDSLGISSANYNFKSVAATPNLDINRPVGSDILFREGGSTAQWGILRTSGEIQPGTDNATDIGDASHRVRSLYVGTTAFIAAMQYGTSSVGAGTQTFTNSPCVGLTTARWIPITIVGQSGTWLIPACQ